MANEKSNGKAEEKTQVKMASIKFAMNPDSVFLLHPVMIPELSRILFLIRMSKVWMIQNFPQNFTILCSYIYYSCNVNQRFERARGKYQSCTG